LIIFFLFWFSPTGTHKSFDTGTRGNHKKKRIRDDATSRVKLNTIYVYLIRNDISRRFYTAVEMLINTTSMWIRWISSLLEK
jgi:hypothetical protein